MHLCYRMMKLGKLISGSIQVLNAPMHPTMWHINRGCGPLYHSVRHPGFA